MSSFRTRRYWSRLMTTLLTVFITASTLYAKPPRRPNIVFILADDMGFSDVGCYGGEIETPNIDSLAAGGLRFSRCYNNAWCAPSRFSLVTGYYPEQQPRAGYGMTKPRSWVRALPHFLKPYGYRCYHAGKWHLEFSPLTSAGFDHSYQTFGQDRFFSPKRHALDERRLPSPTREDGYYATTAITDYAIRFLRDHVAAEEETKSPFLLYLAYTAPHFPLHALQEDIAKYKDRYRKGWDAIREQRWRRSKEQGVVNCDLSVRPTKVPPPVVLVTKRVPDPVSVLGKGETSLAPPWGDLTEKQKEFQAMKMALHAAMVARIDAEVGRVLDQLRMMEAIEDTVIFFASDNGACPIIMIRGDGHDPDATPGSADSYLCMGPGWASASNSPLRMYKCWTFEGGISTPLIVHWPSGIRKRGQIRHAPVHFIDIVPTLVQLAGGGEGDSRPNGAGPALPGRSIVPCFDGDTDLSRDPIFLSQPLGWRHGWPEEDRREWRDHPFEGRCLITSRFKLVKSMGSAWELYDMNTDRCEKHDLAGAMPEKTKQLSDTWEQFARQFKQDAAVP